MTAKITLALPVTLPCTSSLGSAIEFQPGTELDYYKLADGTLLARHDGDTLQWAGEITRQDIAEERHDLSATGTKIQNEALSDHELLMDWTHGPNGTYRVKTLRGACAGYPGQVQNRIVTASDETGTLIIDLDGGAYTGPHYRDTDD
jgi:hypothetical protein